MPYDRMTNYKNCRHTCPDSLKFPVVGVLDVYSCLEQAARRLLKLLSGCLGWPCLCQLEDFSRCGVFPPFTYNIGGILQWDISIHTHTLLAGSYSLSGGIEDPSDTDTSTHIHDP